MAGVELEVRPEDQAIRGFELAEQVFTPERRTAIANFLNVTADDPVLLPYLVTCATYGLSPIMGEIWLIPQKVTVRDGDATKKVERYRPAVGRDGFLSIARRDKRYRGIQGAVVCEHDTFEVEFTGDLENDPKVLHRFASKPTAFEEGVAPDRYRGKIIGAWAKCYVSGQPPQFYFANLREHGKLEHEFEWGQRSGERIWHWTMPDGSTHAAVQQPPDSRPKMGWAGAWDYVSPMILKAAQSYVLRIALGITGLAPADEIVIDREALPAGGGAGAGPALEEFDWTKVAAPDDVRERLQAAVVAANEVAPLSWSPAKCEMVFTGRSAEELLRCAESIEREVELHSARIDPPPSAPAGEEEHEPVGQVEVEDATIVPELTPEEREAEEHREADLIAALEGAEEGSEEHAAHQKDLHEVEARLGRSAS